MKIVYFSNVGLMKAENFTTKIKGTTQIDFGFVCVDFFIF